MKKNQLRRAISFALAAAMTIGTCMYGPVGEAAMAADADAVTPGNIQAEFFVSPTGDDSNPGTYERPFATLEGAREAVAKINRDMTGDIYVFILPGTYYVTETVNFDVADSGTNGHEIIYKCLGEASEAKFVGGMKVESQWEQVAACTNPDIADSDMQQELVGKIYKTNLEGQMNEIFGEGNWPATSKALPLDADGKFTVNTISVNDTRATLARTLNSDKFEGMPATLFDNPLYTEGGGNVDMTYKSGDVSQLYIDQLVNAQKRGDLSAQIVCNDIGGRRAWDSDTLPITSVNASARKLTFNPNDVGHFAPLYTIGGNSRYFLQGNLAFLDTPGEFYYNPETFDLYYYPKDGEEELSEQQIIVPTTDKVISLEGERTGVWDDTKITPVKNITFDGLKFSDTSFPDYYSSGWPWLPYAAGAPGKYWFPEWAQTSTNPIYCGSSERPQFQVGTVTLKYTDSITMKNCQVKNAGMNGIELYLGVTNTLIDNCLVEYCGNGGIMVEGGFPGVDGNSDAVSYTNNNTIQNTVVHDVGQMVHQTFGIQIANATYNTVNNCEVYHSPRRGILLMGCDVNGWNNTASGNRNWAPIAFDIKRDEYTHGNTFSNIYLHDVQQDGGDDGGLFTVFVYYAHHNFSRPNKFDQIVIDEVGANPNMGDIAPNNINLDMGWCGVEMSNIKTVNAQHYTIENSNLQNGQVKVDNCTFYFRNPKDGLDKFDDSKMNYANIGVQAWRYPDAYKDAITSTATERPEDAYFAEDFEDALDWTKWSYSGKAPELTRIYMSEGPFNGKSALVIDNEAASQKPVLYKKFDESLNKVVTVKIFDRQLSPGTTYGGDGRRFPDTGRTTVRVDNGTDEGIITLGIDPSVNGKYYVMNVGGTKTATQIRRVFGWHELKFDYSVPGTVTLYIDGTEVGTASRDSFDYVALGSADGTGENYYDQLYIYSGVDAKAAQTKCLVQKAAVKEAVKSQDGTWIDWKFEDDSDVPYELDAQYGTPFVQAVSGGGSYSGAYDSTTMIDFFNTTFSVVDNPSKTDANKSDKVLGRSGQGGCHTYAPQNPGWKNYVWEFDYLYKSSSDVSQRRGNSVNFIIYSQNTNLGSGYPYQPAGYWFCINEQESALQIRKAIGQSSITGANNQLLTEVKLDAEQMKSFTDPAQWHNISISAQTSTGSTILNVTVDDGVYTLSATDSSDPYTEGTFAYNVMETDFYMDNIKISSIGESPLKGYDKNFKLGNATLDKEFTTDVQSYTAVIGDASQDVTFVKPDGEGATYVISLNDTDITVQFEDTVTPVALELKPGNNILTVTETTAQQIKTVYTIAIYKACTLVSAEVPETMTIDLGMMPELPDQIEAVVNDGQQDMNLTLAVTWDMADQSYYKKPGTFVLKGHLAEVDNGVVAVTVKVDGVNSVDALPVIKGEAAENPASYLPETVGLNYEHSGKQQKAVTFKTLDASVYANEGTIIAVGTVDGYDKDVVQAIELSKTVAADVNKVLLQKTYDYALLQSTEGVAASAVKLFEEAKAQAKKVLDDPNATQEEVNVAWSNLLNAIWGLGIVKGDKAELKDLIDEASMMNKEDYKEDNWPQLTEALEKALQVYGSEDATQDVIDEAAYALRDAIDAQERKPVIVVDKEILRTLVERATKMLPDEAKYVEANWSELVSALAKGQTVYDKADATQEEVDAAADELLKAILAQRLKADKSNLEELLKQVEGLDLEGYTAESVQAFKTAFAKAMAVMADDTLSENDQKVVDDAVKALADATDALEKKDDNKTSDDNKKNSSKAPTTGDSTSMLWILMLAIVSAGTVLAMKRRKMN